MLHRCLQSGFNPNATDHGGCSVMDEAEYWCMRATSATWPKLLGASRIARSAASKAFSAGGGASEMHSVPLFVGGLRGTAWT